MNYRVLVPLTIKAKIAKLPISALVRVAFYRTLHEELSAISANDLGKRIVAPIRCVCREMIVHTDGIETRFWLWINDTKVPDCRSIIDVAIAKNQ